MGSVVPAVLLLLFVLRVARAHGTGGSVPIGRKVPAIVPWSGTADTVRAVGVVVVLVAWSSDDWALRAAALACAALPWFPTTVLTGLLRVLPLSIVPGLATLVAPHWARGRERAWAAVMALESARSPLGEAQLATLSTAIATGAQPAPLTLYARAALADARGDDVEARDLMEALHELVSAPGLEPVQARARVWLAVRAATRGYWPRVEELEEPGDASVRAVAKALRGLRDGRRPDRGEHLLLMGWHRQPRLARALQAVPLPGPVEAPAGPPPDLPPLAAALWWQRRCCLTVPTDAELVACGHAWDGLPTLAAVTDAVRARCDAVGYRPPLEDGEGPEAATIRVLSMAWQEAVRQLAAVAVLSRALPPEDGPTLAHARRLAREQLFKELADHVASLDGPAREAIVADPVVGWLRFHRLRVIVDTLQWRAPLTERAVAFEEVRQPVLGAAVWLYNQRAQRLLAHTMMRWLQAAGEGVMSPDLEQTLRNNLALGY